MSVARGRQGSPATDVVFLVNVRAGRGRVLERLRSALRSGGTGAGRARIVPFRAARELEDAVHALEAGTVPVAVGGDGTVNRLVRALRAAGRGSEPVGVVPLGTGNAFAHALGIRTPLDALEALRRGRLARVDVFVTARPEAPVALASISAGIEARIVRGIARGREEGVLAGIGAVASRRSGSKTGPHLEVDGVVLAAAGERVYNVGLYNIPCYAFGRVMLPRADPADGWGEAVVQRTALSYWRGLLGPDRERALERVPVRRWRRATLRTETPVQVDGESVSGGEWEVSIEPGALRVYAAAVSRNGALTERASTCGSPKSA